MLFRSQFCRNRWKKRPEKNTGSSKSSAGYRENNIETREQKKIKKIVKETELNCEEDEIFEKKLKGYANFVHRKINKYYKENVFREPKNDGGKINFLE